MRGTPVGRQLCALLPVILSQIQAVVAPWDCTTYPYPIQIIKGTSDANYRTMQLNFADGDFTEIWQWTVDSAEQPTAQLNAQGYNTNDDIAYGLFSDSTSSDPDVAPGYFCRFSAVQNSAECLCQAPYWGNTATITSDGTYYLAREGGLEVQKLPDVHNIAYPVGSPVAVSSLSSCGFSNVLSGRGTGGVIDITAWGLTGADMEAAYGLPTDCTQCYMTTGIWTVDVAGTSTGVMQTWKPGGQNMADFIDFEYNSINYLIGLGTYDASVWIIKLDGAGDVTGYAYSRVVVDYTASTSSKRTMGGFGAGYRYGDRIYVRDPPHPHTNTGSGIFEVELASLQAVLDRTGDDACDFGKTSGSRVCAEVNSLVAASPVPLPVTLKWVAPAVAPTQLNDGFNCPDVVDPFTCPARPPDRRPSCRRPPSLRPPCRRRCASRTAKGGRACAESAQWQGPTPVASAPGPQGLGPSATARLDARLTQTARATRTTRPVFAWCTRWP